MRMIPNYESKVKTKIFKYPLTVFNPLETKEIFSIENTVGRIEQLTFHVESGNNQSWKDTVIKIYVDDNFDTEPDIIISSDDIVNGVGYRNTGKRQLNVQTYWFAQNKKSKVSILLGMDFFRRMRMEVTAGNSSTTVGVWMLYKEFYG